PYREITVTTNEQQTNYLLWLKERGMTMPVYREQEGGATKHVPSTAYTSPRFLFVGDGASPLGSGESGPLPEAEKILLHNIAKALRLSADEFQFLSFCPLIFLQPLSSLKPEGVVILVGDGLNSVSGKNLNFEALRGKV